MKKNFETPKMIVVLFPQEDVIVTSLEGPGGIGSNGEGGNDDPGD